MSEKPAKKPYTPPLLKLYGHLSLVTHSNSGAGHMDNGTGGMKTS